MLYEHIAYLYMICFCCCTMIISSPIYKIRRKTEIIRYKIQTTLYVHIHNFIRYFISNFSLVMPDLSGELLAVAVMLFP